MDKTLLEILACPLCKSSVLFNSAEVTITDQANAGFRIVDLEPVNAPSRSTITTSRISLLGNFYKDPADPIFDPANPIYDPANPIYDRESALYNPNAVRPTFIPYDPNSPYNDPHTETWAVSKPIMVDQVDLGPDWSRSIATCCAISIANCRSTPTCAPPMNCSKSFVCAMKTRG